MAEKRGFWRSQFAAEVTPRQRGFDVFFGLVAPVACILWDPCVFRTDSPYGTPWIAYGGGAYVFIGLEILTLAAWLAIPRKGPYLTLALAGPLIAGGLASMGLGVRLLPLSLIGLLFLIGALGFTPFFTGFVFLRNGVRAWRSLPEEHRPHLAREIALLFALLTMGAAAGGQWASDRSMTLLIADPESTTARRIVRWMGRSRTDDLVLAWQKETDPARKGRLAKIYFELTGTGIEDRDSRLRD